MQARAPEDLGERSFRFTCDAFDYCEALVKCGGLSARVGYQLWDAASSVGANRAESKSAYSAKEFAAKNAICLKESRETVFWLRLAEMKQLGDATTRHELLEEATQLVAIFVTIVRTLQTRLNA